MIVSAAIALELVGANSEFDGVASLAAGGHPDRSLFRSDNLCRLCVGHLRQYQHCKSQAKCAHHGNCGITAVVKLAQKGFHAATCSTFSSISSTMRRPAGPMASAAWPREVL